MFRRRSFLIGCGSLAAAPALAGGTVDSAATGSAAPPLPAAPVSAAEAPALLRIAGWDAAGPSSAGDGGMWVQISSSWQVAWR